MRFSVLHTSLLALAAVANAQSYANVVNSLQALASKATNLIAPAEQLSLTNAPLLLIGGGPWAVRLTPRPLLFFPPSYL